MTSFRVAARHRAAVRVGVRVGDALERDAELEDIGLEGARLRMRPVPAVGSLLRLRLDAPTRWAPLELDAIVRWTSVIDDEGVASVGCELSPLGPTPALALAEWLAGLPRVSTRARA